MKTPYIVLFLALIWCVSILLNTHFLVPRISAVDLACNSRTSDADIIEEVYYVFAAIWVIFGDLTPLTISIVIPIVVLCYVRRNTIAEGSSYNKRIARFILFVAAGNLISILSQLLIYLSVFVLEYPFHPTAAISLIPTPIMILIFLKPVRAQVTKMLCHARIPSIRHISKTSTTVD